MNALNVFGSSSTVSFHTPSTFPATYCCSVYGLETVFLSTSALLVPLAASISSSDKSSFFEQEMTAVESAAQKTVATQRDIAFEKARRLLTTFRLFIFPPTTIERYRTLFYTTLFIHCITAHHMMSRYGTSTRFIAFLSTVSVHFARNRRARASAGSLSASDRIGQSR